MAKYRNVYMSFWTDSKVIEKFTPEDRYFYLYLMTNPHTSLCGCYEVSLTQMANETGYNKDSIEKLIVRFMEVHDLIRYDFSTNEVIILNWHKYNWNNSGKLIAGVENGIECVKNPVFKQYLEHLSLGHLDGSIGYVYGTQGPYTFLIHDLPISVNDNSTVTKNKNMNLIIEIVDYFNRVTGKSYRASSRTTKAHIEARLNEGFVLEDFKKVIDVKTAEWKNDQKMCNYLRPETLFGTKFESYLNQNTKSQKGEQAKALLKMLEDEE